jgi:PAS domain S-box-containing protein
VRDIRGQEHWFETTQAPVLDQANDVIGVILNARDVSERKRAEDALRESEERYRDLFENASDLICVTDTEGAFLYVNHAWHERMGYTDADLERLRMADLVHQDSREHYREVMERVLAGEPLDHVELVFLTRVGEPVTVEGNLSCTFREGRVRRLRCILRDVTERKRVEEHLRRAERMQAAGRLAGGVAHEVNNMMTGVIGFSEFLLRTLEPGDSRRSEVEEIIRAGSRAADVTRQLLAFTRQQFLRPEVLDPVEVVRAMEKLLRRSLGEEHVLELALSPETGEIRADRGQLEQVLLNLVLNARDALIERGRVTIATGSALLDEVYAQRHPGIEITAGAYTLVSVSDTGCGMDREVQARIFEPFFTTKPVGQGTGLGLSTVYGIVKQSEGFIWVYSEPGQGSTFKVYLPRVGAPRRAQEPVPHTATPRGGTETILVVEDEDIVRALACRGLREQGYTVFEARNGTEGLRMFEARPHGIDLVVTDVVMPEMGGRELAQRLAVLEPGLPVLFTSGYTGDDVIQRGLLEPGAPFQQKPFTPEALAAAVREMLDARARQPGGV